MKLFDIEKILARNDLPVRVIDYRTGRIAFDGDAMGLLDLESTEKIPVVRMDLDAGKLIITARMERASK